MGIVVHIRLSPNKASAYISSYKVGGKLFYALEELGAFREAKMNDNLILPLSKAVALRLREVLRGEELTLEDGAGAVLAHIADSMDKVRVDRLLMSSDGKVLIDAQLAPIVDYATIKSATKKVSDLAPVVDGVFRIEPERLDDFIALLPPHIKQILSGSSLFIYQGDNENMGNTGNNGSIANNEDRGSRRARGKNDASTLPGLENVQQFKNTSTASSTATRSRSSRYDANLYDQDKIVKTLSSWPQYDGTIDSLRKVKLSDYEIISRDSTKVKERNAKKPKKGKGSKPERSMAQKLASMGLTTAYDILNYFPYRHIDRSSPRTMASMRVGEEGSVIAYVLTTKSEYGNPSYARFTLEDSAGYRFDVTLWRQPYASKYYSKGDQVIVSGKVGEFRGKRQMERPSLDKVGSDRSAMSMIPVYHQSEAQQITTYDIMGLVQETMGHMKSKPLIDPVSDDILESHGFISRWDAYFNLHFPKDRPLYEAAYQRMVYDEFLRLQMFIQQRKTEENALKGLSQNKEGNLISAWLDALPYEPTNAQKRAMKNVGDAMESPKPLHTLVQGDVGAGKSTIANFVMLKTLENGYQGAILAPTDILAEQLYDGFLEASAGMISPRTGKPVDVRFLGKKNKGLKQEKINKADLREGIVDVMIGTHSLVFESTKFSNLGAVVLDEQHRFGVEQRSHLRNFGRDDDFTPDMLLMTATPIPRSSAQVLYGDLDIEVLDELPPGRKAIETRWERVSSDLALQNQRLPVWNAIREEVRAGRQAYVVATLVEDNEKMQEKSVIETYETMRDYLFPDMRIGYVHGRMKKAERDDVMGRFKEGNLDILVATTVIEVGVNVPNSTIICILDPGRFGIAQLHQLRGRVGRSSYQSYCWLVGEVTSEKGEANMEAIVSSTDGFFLAERDLQIRGEGKLFSTSQSGEGDFRLASVVKHGDILTLAVDDAAKLLSTDVSSDRIKSRAMLMLETDRLFGNQDIYS